jgi:hypothetical protein
MILVLVVLVTVTVGIVQFGLFLAKAQQVSLAARVGALEASQTHSLDDDCQEVPENVIRAIEHQLESSGIDWCAIRLEHDVTRHRRQVALLSTNCADCELATDELLDCPPSRRYVRLTVGVPLGELIPTQLSYFGEQLFGADRVYEHTTLLRYELCD